MLIWFSVLWYLILYISTISSECTNYYKSLWNLLWNVGSRSLNNLPGICSFSDAFEKKSQEWWSQGWVRKNGKWHRENLNIAALTITYQENGPFKKLALWPIWYWKVQETCWWTIHLSIYNSEMVTQNFLYWVNVNNCSLLSTVNICLWKKLKITWSNNRLGEQNWIYTKFGILLH